MLPVQLGINSTREVWKLCQIGRAAGASTSLVLLIPNITRTINPYNCTRQRMITYTNIMVA